MKLDCNIKYLKGVGERRAGFLKKLGIATVGDLLHFYPRAYEDWSRISAIDEAQIGEICCIKAVADRKPAANLIRKGLTIYKTEVTDGKSVMQITIFNSQYAAEKIEEGKEYLFFGRVGGNLWRKEMNSPEIVRAQGGDRIRPVYHSTQGLSSAIIERLMSTAVSQTKGEIAEALPQHLRDKYYLCKIEDAIADIHFPRNSDYLEIARRRLIFEELLLLQLGLSMLKTRGRSAAGEIIADDFTADFARRLPFRLTGAQQRAISQAAKDMSKPVPMNRLLQGDVGSGKTAVAASLIYSAARNGVQSVLMAPTEILARQHFLTFKKLFDGTGITVSLLTGSSPAAQKRKIKEQVALGEIMLLIGTHAVIQGDVVFSRLGLVVTDEQHRFGVMQRAALGIKGHNPHTLVMSATPIPRTLALVIYGDLDVSVLDELPPGRMPVKTYLIDSSKRSRAFGYIRKHLDRGLQGYIVCPLVEEGETELAAAKEYSEMLASDYFKGYSVGLLHGRMKASEKNEAMSGFVDGRVQLLVSTTVIEVGVDVPNAVIILIENAERFGLSQLHQLRGRIGRGSAASSCILVSDAQNAQAQQRLQIMTKTTDGFEIAGEDLKLRGPGDFFGARQHGLPEMKIADMLTDTRLLAESGNAAKELLNADPFLEAEENLLLKEAVADLFKMGQ